MIREIILGSVHTFYGTIGRKFLLDVRSCVSAGRPTRICFLVCSKLEGCYARMFSFILC